MFDCESWKLRCESHKSRVINLNSTTMTAIHNLKIYQRVITSWFEIKTVFNCYDTYLNILQHHSRELFCIHSWFKEAFTSYFNDTGMNLSKWAWTNGFEYLTTLTYIKESTPPTSICRWFSVVIEVVKCRLPWSSCLISRVISLTLKNFKMNYALKSFLKYFFRNLEN